MSENPYAAPETEVSLAESSDESIRRELIKHETSVKSIGLLYWLGGILLIIGGAGAFFNGEADGITAGLMSLTFAAFFIIVAISIRKLQQWARIASIVISCIGLLGFPIGTVINGYILYLLLSKKGGRIFSPSHQEVIANTPHIKYGTSKTAWIVLVVFLLLLGGLIAYVANA